MRIGVATSFACGVGMWKRLADEGNDVSVWRGSEKDGSPELLTSHRKVGEGIVPLIDSWNELLAWCKDGQRSGTPTMLLFDSSGIGKLADEARKAGLYVVGGGSFCDRLEKDRSFGRKIALENGVESPGVVEFESIDQCLAFADSGGVDRPVYWKTDAYIDGDATHKCADAQELTEYLTWIKTRTRANISCILEECLDGFALSTWRAWNGRAWVGPYNYTLEQKAFMPGGIGPSTGCSLNAVGFYEMDQPKIATALNWDGFTEAWLKHEAPPGIYDINAIVSDGSAYMLEWTPRFGWDSEGTSNLLFDDFSAWLWWLATGQGEPVEPRRDEFAMAIRLTVPPAPWEHGTRDEKGSAVGIPVRGDTGDLWSGPFVAYQVMQDESGYAVAAPEALVGLSAAVGDRASTLAEEITDFPKDCLRVPGLMYRNDVGKAIESDTQKCIDEGFDDLPEGLLQ